MIHIASPDDPRVQPYRVMTLGNAGSHDRAGTFIADSERVVEALLRSEAETRSIFALPEFYEKHAELIAKRGIAADALLAAPPAVMEGVTGFRHHSGVMAVGVQPPFAPPETTPLPAVALCGVINPDNVGAIARNCAGLGFRSLIVDGASCSPYLRRAMRVSMGATLALEVCKVGALPPVLEMLRRERGALVVGAEIAPNAVPPEEVAWRLESVVVFGSEASGIPSDVLAACDATTAIAMLPPVRSLNVAAASAIILYAAADGPRESAAD